MVVVTHDLELAAAARRTIQMRDGEIVAQLGDGQIVAQPAV